MDKDKKRAGRPSDYNEAIAQEICEQVAAGRSIIEICSADHMPVPSTVFLWLTKHHEFSDQYARAREAQGDLMDKMIMEAATQEPERVVIRIGEDATKEGVDAAEVQHRRLKIDALKWRAAHLRPKVYGVQRQEIEHKGKLTLEQLLTQASEPKKKDGDK